MFIVVKYLELAKNQQVLSDDEFIGRQIWHLEHVLSNEMAAIKNAQCEFIAFTDKMSQEFSLGSKVLGKTFNEVSEVSEMVRNEVYRQEQELLKQKVTQNSYYFYNKGKEICNYFVRKRPLINPSTGNTVGIFITSEKALPNTHRKFIMQEFIGLSKQSPSRINPILMPLQQQVLFCLLLGISNRKDITHTLNNLTSNYLSENQIKNTLQSLYNKFECSSPSQLVNLMLNDQIPFELPENTIPPGNYLL